MLKKIISGGQVGADQAALDAAIKCKFPHGGWIQRGKKTQTGILPEKYHLIEMTVSGYKERIEQNVIESDGTVIISHGNLSGGADYSRKMAKKHRRPCLHIDLSHTPAAISSSEINTWIIENSIEVLNVTGSRASEDGDVYKDTIGIIEGAILLSLVNAKSGERLMDHSRREYLEKAPISPKTIDEAVDQLIFVLDSKDKLKIANMKIDNLIYLDADLHHYFKNVFNVWHGNKDLLADCRSVSKEPIRSENEAEFVIIKTLWERLKKTHGLRVVK
ncbi:MAG: putative molybdenum carrier protein [Desulfobacterales bacterium]